MPVLLNPEMDRKALKNSKVVGYNGRDIRREGKSDRQSFDWAWYEEGLYTANAGFSAHHTAPLYFDYINNPQSASPAKKTLRDKRKERFDLRHQERKTAGIRSLLGQGRKREYVRLGAG